MKERRYYDESNIAYVFHESDGNNSWSFEVDYEGGIWKKKNGFGVGNEWVTKDLSKARESALLYVDRVRAWRKMSWIKRMFVYGGYVEHYFPKQ